MTVDEYFSQIKALLSRYTSASFVIDVQVTFEIRLAEQGFLTGAVKFLNGSNLYFREYLDTVDDDIEKVTYVYHYQDSQDRMIIRYDNAAHKPGLLSTAHKHDADGVKAAEDPRLEDVLTEIVEMGQWA